MSDGKPYALLVFDWDGTLMDSTAKIVDSQLLPQPVCRSAARNS
jgi:phosphoglycolate phosphatase-like HAD superfamily hydrolase